MPDRPGRALETTNPLVRSTDLEIYPRRGGYSWSDSDTGSGENQLVCRAAGQLRSNPDPKGEADSSSVSIIGTFFIFIGIPNTEPVVKVVPHEVFRIEHGKVL